jgi:hypothetical protein
MIIEAGKRYVMRYGGITGVMRRHDGCRDKWSDGYLNWNVRGSYFDTREDPWDLIAEYNPHDAPCELRAGGKYVLDNGDVVKLDDSGFTVPCVHRFLPLSCDGMKYGYVTCDGEVLGYHDKPEAVARITAEYIEPKPPTPIERLEKAIQLFANPRTDDEAFALVRGVIADLKAEAAK